MKIKDMREAIVGASATPAKWLYTDLTLDWDEPLDTSFRDFITFIFRSELTATGMCCMERRPIIALQIVPSHNEVNTMSHSVYSISGAQQFRITIDNKSLIAGWYPFMTDKHNALFASGFAAYALKNDIEIYSPQFAESAKCYDYFPAVAWLRENRDYRDYDYILGKLYDYVTSNNCLDKLLDFYDGLGDMEGKAEFMHYCGEHGTFEQAEMRL